MNDERLYLLHIRECIERIEEYTAKGREAFLTDTRTQDAERRNLQVMCESTQRVSKERKAAHSEIDWKGMAGFRNVLVHDYLGVDIRYTWEVVQTRLPALKQAVETMHDELHPPPDNPGQ